MTGTDFENAMAKVDAIYTQLATLAAKLDTVAANQQAAMSGNRSREDDDERNSGTYAAMSTTSCKVVVVMNPSLANSGFVRYGDSGTEHEIPPATVREFIVSSNANELQWKSASALHTISAIFYSISS